MFLCAARKRVDPKNALAQLSEKRMGKEEKIVGPHSSDKYRLWTSIELVCACVCVSIENSKSDKRRCFLMTCRTNAAWVCAYRDTRCALLLRFAHPFYFLQYFLHFQFKFHEFLRNIYDDSLAICFNGLYSNQFGNGHGIHKEKTENSEQRKSIFIVVGIRRLFLVVVLFKEYFHSTKHRESFLRGKSGKGDGGVSSGSGGGRRTWIFSQNTYWWK